MYNCISAIRSTVISANLIQDLIYALFLHAVEMFFTTLCSRIQFKLYVISL